jgi:molecular chaperone GrpE (heat shock protein)
VAAVKVTIKDEDKKKETNEDRQGRPGGQAEKEEEEISREEMSKEDLIEKVKQLEDLSAKNFDLYVRSQAEIENMKKRFQRDREEWIKFSNESLIKEILPSVDNLEKAIAHSRDVKPAWKRSKPWASLLIPIFTRLSASTKTTVWNQGPCCRNFRKGIS